MMAQESTPIHGGLFPDSCGLVKTLSALWLGFVTRKLADSQTPHTFGSALIVASVPIQWADHIDHVFQGKLHLILFLGSWTTCAVSRKEGTIKSWNEIRDKYSAVDVGSATPDTGF